MIVNKRFLHPARAKHLRWRNDAGVFWGLIARPVLLSCAANAVAPTAVGKLKRPCQYCHPYVTMEDGVQMKGESKSCFGSLVLLVVALALVRFAIPGLWKVIVIGSAGVVSIGLLVFVIALVALGYFTYRNLSSNKAKQEGQKFSKVSRVEQMYAEVQSRLDRSPGANQVLADEFLQAEILIKDKLQQIKTDLIRLKEMTSPKNQKIIEDQLRDYRRQLREATDATVRKVIDENIAMVQGNKDRLTGAVEEIRSMEALLDLLYHSLVKADEDLKLGRPVQQIFSPEVYARFGVSGASSNAEPLPPMPQKSSLTE